MQQLYIKIQQLYRQQKFGSGGECYVYPKHQLKQMKQCYEKQTQEDPS